MSTHEDQDRLGRLYAALSGLLSEKDSAPGVAKLIEEHGQEDVSWVLSVLAEDLQPST